MMKYLPMRTLVHVLTLCSLLFVACRKDVKTPEIKQPPKPRLEFLSEQTIKPENLDRVTARTVNSIAPNSLWAGLISNVVGIYRVTYPTTDPNGVPVEASGLLVIPKYDGELSLVSFQNGTVFNPAFAASFFNPDGDLHYWIPVAAALGHIVIVPDYLGYGSTANLDHPYQQAASLARTTADFLIATKGILQDLHVKWNNKLFLAGYSEGGYATAAVHKLLQEQYAGQFKVTAASYGAGAYDITATAKYFLNLNEDRDSFFVRTHSWVVLTYNKVHHLNRPLDSYFVQPYATELATHSIPASVLPLNPAQLVTPSFKAGILNGTDTAFLRVLKQNDLYDWKPEAPVLLVHADGDRNVPILNSEHALAIFRQNGADVTYLVIPNKTHQQAIPDFAISSLLYFALY